jgi:hypothetical protein
VPSYRPASKPDLTAVYRQFLSLSDLLVTL